MENNFDNENYTETKNEKHEFEFSIVSFLKIFKGKLKMLVTVGVIAAILGGTIGALSVAIGKKTYGNLLAFQFPTPEKTGYSTVIPLLESDLFTESILIGTKTVSVTTDEGVVNVTIPDLKYSSYEQATLSKYEADRFLLTDDIKNYKTALKSLPIEISNLKSQLDAASNAYAPYKEEYNKLLMISSEGLSSTALEKLTALENSAEYITAKTNFTDAQKAYDEKVIEQTSTTEALFKAEKALTEATEKANEIIEACRADWRKDPQNKELVEDFSDYVTYSFTKDNTPTDPILTTPSTEDTSGKFLYINVRIPEDKALADKVINNILRDISTFVISNTTPVETNDQIECIRITSGEAKDVNENSMLKTSLIYAGIFFAVIEAITCLIIICSYLKRTFFPAPENEAVVASGVANEKANSVSESTEEQSEEKSESKTK